MKKTLIVTLTIVSLLTITGCGKETKLPEINSDIKTNVNEKIIKSQEISGLKFDNTSVVYENGISTVTITITNVTESAMKVNTVNMIFVDSEGLQTSLIALIDDNINPNQSITVSSNTDIDLTKAVSVEYKID